MVGLNEVDFLGLRMVRGLPDTGSCPAQTDTWFRYTMENGSSCTMLCVSPARAHALMRYKVSELPGGYLKMIYLVMQGEYEETKTRLLSDTNVRSLWNYRKVDMKYLQRKTIAR
jgi:hypothetical protein